MTTSPDPIQLFVDAIGRTPALWQSMDVRVLAVRVEGEWHNMLTRCYLDHRPPAEVTRLRELPRTPLVGAWQWVRPVTQLEQLLADVKSGNFAVDNTRICYRALEAPEAHNYYSFGDYGFSDLAEHYRTAYRFWSCHMLSASGNTVHDLLRSMT